MSRDSRYTLMAPLGGMLSVAMTLGAALMLAWRSEQGESRREQFELAVGAWVLLLGVAIQIIYWLFSSQAAPA
ncbi:MAG: hypothetical protein LBE62_05970 [Azonexus sp.]|nr:hypothetical protein [Azonexus sp.]